MNEDINKSTGLSVIGKLATIGVYVWFIAIGILLPIERFDEFMGGGG